VHGVYPALAWTPDGESLVFWAAGKIRRVDVATGEAAVIPFRVRGARQIGAAIRFPVDVAPETFDVKMIQHATVSPQGDRLVFQALGHLYTASFRDGAVGEPQRLTSANDEFAYYPSWSRDGERIVYVAWNDERLAAVRVIPARGGRAETVTTEPGHYLNPVFSPDGRMVVWEKTGGGYLTSPLWGRDPGVYAAAFGKSGAPTDAADWPRLIAKRGRAPQFGAASDRVYLTVREGGADTDAISLISVPLAGTTPTEGERTHFQSDWATEMRVSPDGRQIAFAERYNVYVAPFVDAGKPYPRRAEGQEPAHRQAEPGSGQFPALVGR
jgi:dipeptidyl aminopeptidase/acylaminoacyl peptidase